MPQRNTKSSCLQLLPVQQSKIPAYTLGAMTPSLRLYAFLSKEMQKVVTPCVNSHPYSKWFKEYSYKNFEKSYLHAEVLLDKLCNSLAQEEIEIVERLCRHAMRLEMDFFYPQQSEQTLIITIYTKLDPKEERLMLFADFDFTCTSVASLEILANIEILTAQKPGQQLQGEDRDGHSHIPSVDLSKTYELLSQHQQYTSENDNFIEKIMLSKKAVSFDYEGLYSALGKLLSPEAQAVSRVFDSGLLKGISLEDIKQAAKMMLQNGCVIFFEKVNSLDVSDYLTRSALSGGTEGLRAILRQLFSQKHLLESASQGCSSSPDGGDEKQVKKIKNDLEPFWKCSHCNRDLVARNLTTYFNARFLRVIYLRGRGIVGGAAAGNPDLAEFDLLCRFCRCIVGYGFLRPLHQRVRYLLMRERVH
ncbi:bifunctional TH2 protein, mitochondrial-like isoform X2 [Papaver somniferum]|uniref:bifunctional TH2 protein, mitochondrial-like isoform X2 n=1 Tax=Papaver somniferum TaxID=3469 RepID=UPI000E705006|nr:bifunctional TH2 protein, mitochondrial-like isoform X2 [Papaver somniferum]